MTAPATVQPPILEPALDVTEGGTFPIVRSAREVAADVAVIGCPPLAALAGWAVTGSPLVLGVAGVVGAVAAMAAECTRRHV